MPKFHDLSSGSLAWSAGAGAAYSVPAAREREIAGGVAPDPLSDVLRTVRLTGALFFLWDVSWPYATPVPDGRAFAPIVLPGAQQIVSYHVVTQGTCWASLIGGPPVHLEAGDVLLVPRGAAYVMASSAQRCSEARLDVEHALGFFRQMAAGELPFVVADGGGESVATHLICGFLGCDLLPFNPALAALPELVHLRTAADPARDRLRSLIEYTLAEAREPRAGSRSMLVRLAELMFVEIVRRCLEQALPGQSGWPAALRDPVTGRALGLLHSQPTAAWTLERLAGEVGVSRSRLAECFTRLVGQPPMLYLARWRLQLAARMLAEGSAKVATVGREVGYESEAAFSRAFKRFAGVPPIEWRRKATSAHRA
jgi:AraC-like DNA-binding protein